MTAPANSYMLDTTLFNDVLDGKVSVTPSASRRLLVTGIQASELRATKNEIRRAALLAAFEELNPSVALTSSFAFDIEGAGWDEACWNDGSGNYERMLKRLKELDPGTKDSLNQTRDILIAETTIKNGVTLVSGDNNLRQVVSEVGGRAIDHKQFESECPLAFQDSVAEAIHFG
jgi:predicted nucleic acid-binding protein